MPARGRLGGSIAADGENIFPAKINPSGKLILKADVPVGPVTKRNAVDPDIAVLHHPIEFHKYAASGFPGRQREMLAIPHHAARQKRAGTTGKVGLGKGSGDAPIVGHIQLLPAGIGKGAGGGTHGIAGEKFPAGVKISGDPLRQQMARQQGERGAQDKVAGFHLNLDG